MANLADASAVDIDPNGPDGTYSANLDPEWTIGGRPHGGYLLVVLGRAALAAAPAHPHPISASAVFVSSPEVGPATVVVEPLRQGRTASQVRARLVQKDLSARSAGGDQVRVEALFTLGRLDPTAGERWVDVGPPDVAPHQECQRSIVKNPNGLTVGMLDMIDQRIDPVSFSDAVRSDGSGDLRGWLSFADGSEFDALSLLYAADAFPPATFTIGSVGWVPTLELTMYLRALPAPGPLRIRQRARVVAGGFVDQICEAWDSQGRVVFQATQLAAVRMKEDA